MSFRCKNGPEHRHNTREQARVCWGIGGAPTRPAYVPPAAPVRPYGGSDCPTPRMLRYVGYLGGDSILAASFSFKQCSDYIDRLKKEKTKVTESVSAHREQKGKVPPELLKLVEPGRYAVRADAAHPYTFIRVSHPKTGNYKDAIKVQTQHADRLSAPKLVIWPSGKVSLYDVTIEDPLLLVVADRQGAARAYAKELGRCARCGVELTDEQSRRYGIGPECIKHWPWMAVLAEEEAGT